MTKTLEQLKQERDDAAAAHATVYAAAHVAADDARAVARDADAAYATYVKASVAYAAALKETQK